MPDRRAYWVAILVGLGAALVGYILDRAAVVWVACAATFGVMVFDGWRGAGGAPHPRRPSTDDR